MSHRHEHVEPRDIAGADLPDWMQQRGPIQGIIHSVPVAIVLWAIIAGVAWQLIANWPAGWLL